MAKVVHVMVPFECEDEELAARFIHILTMAMDKFARELEGQFSEISLIDEVEGGELVGMEQQEVKSRDEI